MQGRLTVNKYIEQVIECLLLEHLREFVEVSGPNNFDQTIESI